MATAKVKSKKFSKKAAGLKGMWKTAKKQMEEEGDIFGITVEDGPYIAQLTAASVKESAAGWPYVDWEFTVLEGDSEGEAVSRRSGIETEENLVWLMRDFVRFGLDPDELDINDKDDLEEVLTQLVKAAPKCRIFAKTNDAGYQNIFINKVIEIEETSDNGKDFEKGDRVSAEIGDETYEGTIKELKEDKALVQFDDGDVEAIDLDELTKLEESAAGFEEGDRVEVDIDGTDYPGKITSIGDDKAEVKFDDGDKGTYDLDELTKLDEGSTGDAEDWLGEEAGFKKGKKMLVGKIIGVDKVDNTFIMKVTDTGRKVTGDIDDLEKVEEPEPGFEKGDRVSCDIDGTTYEGTIKKIQDDTAVVVFDDGDVETIDLDELTKLDGGTEDGPSGDEGELNIGDKVEVSYKGKDLAGTVKKINEKDEEVTVLLKKTKRTVTVPVDNITILG